MPIFQNHGSQKSSSLFSHPDILTQSNDQMQIQKCKALAIPAPNIAEIKYDSNEDPSHRNLTSNHHLKKSESVNCCLTFFHRCQSLLIWALRHASLAACRAFLEFLHLLKIIIFIMARLIILKIQMIDLILGFEHSNKLMEERIHVEQRQAHRVESIENGSRNGSHARLCTPLSGICKKSWR